MVNNKLIINGYSKYRFFGASILLDNHYFNKNLMRIYSLFILLSCGHTGCIHFSVSIPYIGYVYTVV